ncbi:MAG: cation:dicarboxylase symporter family transporter [Pseudomonadales bacterium]|jgi:L-cystine uptake protein TcyP (sodium:dicarboxylate symporter family)|nr:cation:dicarboxylase symporter family transporter [Pseudomonadales bacterium]
MFVIVNLAVFAAVLVLLFNLRGWGLSLSRQILAGLVAGVVYGLGLQLGYGSDHAAVQGTLEWTNVIGTSYVNLLKMIIMPLVLVMMIAAVVKMREVAALGRIGGSVIGILVVTTMIAALVGILVTNLFGLTADAITQGARELERAAALERRYEGISELGLADMLVRFIPQNVFEDLTGARATSIIAVVVFGILFGIAALGVMKEHPERAEKIFEFTETVRLIIMKLVHMVMALTPYGILALITKVVAGSDAADIANLIMFIVASYVAIAIMFGVHALLLVTLGGVNVRAYFAKVWPVLTFAFTSRSSAATIPLNVETQVEELNVPTPIANLSATFGATIGQNGCAGIYPAMLAVMIAPSMGVDPLALDFIAGLVLIVAISSFGIAGVGGGATFAALVVLPALGFPVTVAAVLISIEPLIDMARTALNVNGAMTAGVITGRWLGDAAEPEAEAQPA